MVGLTAPFYKLAFPTPPVIWLL